jgi:hypothetical protein
VRVHSPTSRSGSRIYLSIWDLFWALVSPILALHLRDVDLNADWSVIANYWVLSAGFAILWPPLAVRIEKTTPAAGMVSAPSCD